MNCATHPDLPAVAFCRTCGKALCQNCTRDVRGVIYCENCLAARIEGSAPAAGFVPPQAAYPPLGVPGAGRTMAVSSGPNPAVAGILAGFFPFGVGAVYCSQYAKGLAHLLIFVLLVVGANQGSPLDAICGISLAFFIVYQIIDAVRTARALQSGQPAPDPLGLGQAFGGGERTESTKIPVGAVVLIGLGVLFLLHTMGLWRFGFERFWPLIIVFLGAWMFYRHWERSSRRCGCARCRTRWLMGPSVVLVTGILFLLHTTNVASLDRTWPAWILVVGVVKLLQSSASSAGHLGPVPPAPPSGVIPPPEPPTSSGTQAPSSGEVRNV